MVRVSKSRNPSQNRKNRQNLSPRRFQILISNSHKPAPPANFQNRPQRNFLSSSPRKAKELTIHEEDQSTAAEDMPELQEDSDCIEVLTGKIKDLKSALECAQIQICSYEKRMESLQKKFADNVWFDALSQMNSPSMGMLLDQFAAAEENLRKLRSRGVEIPREIESIPACIRMFMRAMGSLGVAAIEKPGAVLNITLAESESYEYSGSDFVDSVEQKAVQVLSPGWIYGDRIVSLPRVVEQLAPSQN